MKKILFIIGYLITQVATLQRYNFIPLCDSVTIDDVSSQEVPYGYRREPNTTWKCVDGYQAIFPIQECQYHHVCGRGYVIHMHPSCSPKPSSCPKERNEFMDGELIHYSEYSRVNTKSDISRIKNEFEHICMLDNTVISDCIDYDEKWMEVYILADIEGNVRLLQRPNLIHIEPADDIGSYSCGGGDCKHSDCFKGECKGDEKYMHNFRGTSLSDCYCRYLNSSDYYDVRQGAVVATPKLIVKTWVKVRAKVVPQEVQEVSCSKCHAECTKTGLKIQTGMFKSSHFLICANPRCIASTYDESNEFEANLPKDMVMHGGLREITLWDSQSQIQHKFSTNCAPVPECDLVNCFFCKDGWIAVNCYTPTHWIAVGFLSSIGLWIFAQAIWVCQKIAIFATIMMLPVRATAWLIARTGLLSNLRKAFNKKKDVDMADMVERGDLGKFDLAAATFGVRRGIMLALLLFCGVVDSCSATTTLQSTQRMCYVEAGREVCAITGQMRLSLSPVGQSSCFRLYDSAEKPLGGFIVKTEQIQLTCMKEFLYYVPRSQVKCVSHKRCRGAGDCTGTMCEDTKPNDGSDIWSGEIMANKGRTQCTRVPGCAGNYCGLCADACLWYRSYLTNPSAKTYEVFDCPSWSFSVKVEVSRGEGMELRQETAILTAGVPQRLMDATVTLVSVSVPPQPILGKCVIRADDGRYGLVECNRQSELASGKIGEINCPTVKDAKTITKECSTVSNYATITTQTDSVTCASRLTDPEKALTSDPLPKKMEPMSIYGDKSGVHAQLEHNAILELQVDLDNAHFTVVSDRSACSLRVQNMTGCYSCSTGATVNVIGHTDVGSTVAYIDCRSKSGEDKWKSQILLQEAEKAHQLIMHSDDAIVDYQCDVSCPAGKTKFKLTGELKRAGWADDTNDETTTGVETGDDKKGIRWDDILNASWFNTWWKRVLVIIGTVILIIIFLVIISMTCRRLGC